MIKLFGGLIIIVAAGACGFHMAAGKRQELSELRQLLLSLQIMQREIEWNQLPFTQLCLLLSEVQSGKAAQFFLWIYTQCQQDTELSVAQLFAAGFDWLRLPAAAGKIYASMGETFGRYDPQQQVLALQSAAEQMWQLCEKEQQTQSAICRKYQVFSICIGAAIVILLL